MGSRRFYLLLVILPVIYCFPGCEQPKPPETVIVSTPEELNPKVTDIIRGSLNYAAEKDGTIDDTIRLFDTKTVRSIYEGYQYASLWSRDEAWLALGDSMRTFLEDAKVYGLFPEDYHFPLVDSMAIIFERDSLATGARRDAVRWAKADILLTDAFVKVVKDLKLGRLPVDSLTQRRDTGLTEEFYTEKFRELQQHRQLSAVWDSVEPRHRGYQMLKATIRDFLDSADNRTFTVVPPRKDTQHFKMALRQRLVEGGYLAGDSLPPDSADLAVAIREFQKSAGITVDGKAGNETIRALNITDRDRFLQIAISLDRYKMLPEKMPDRFLWVNLPAYNLKLIENDSVLINSRIICGKTITRTPLLTSAISDMITYPQWTIPTSIIVKEILPAMKKDTNYLARKGYSLIDKDGNVISPGTVDWSKYSKGIPYKVVQGSGDENALGILKFNFPNKYAVYLHDTNQRYLFSRDIRSLSHGCVRVQQWEELAYNIVRYDNRERYGDAPSPVEDSLSRWLVRKEKHVISVKKRLPLFIRYFTAEAVNGKTRFYDDIYGEDQVLRELAFPGK
jgi:murein L,D-transpeptidase YcbB/YkuD